jgi:hypothetical protein
MSFRTASIALIALMLGVLFGLGLSHLAGGFSPAALAQVDAKGPTNDVAALRAEVERLKKVVPGQAHAMQDVDYHFTNLWFAAQQSNWPLARFYFDETRSHLRWAVRIIPVRKDGAGQEIKLEDILDAVENSPLKQLDEAIEAKDRDGFVAAYEFTLASCYACHKASDKPYLRPRIPEHPATSIINLDPNATWPR